MGRVFEAASAFDTKPQRAAGDWLIEYAAFWKVRAGFYTLAWGKYENDPTRAARRIPEEPDYLALNPVTARGLWDRAMREAGGILSRETVAEMTALGSTGRRAMVDACAETLGLTPAGRARYAPFVMLEDDGLWLPGFWEWVAREGIAGEASAL